MAHITSSWIGVSIFVLLTNTTCTQEIAPKKTPSIAIPTSPIAIPGAPSYKNLIPMPSQEQLEVQLTESGFADLIPPRALAGALGHRIVTQADLELGVDYTLYLYYSRKTRRHDIFLRAAALREAVIESLLKS